MDGGRGRGWGRGRFDQGGAWGGHGMPGGRGNMMEPGLMMEPGVMDGGPMMMEPPMMGGMMNHGRPPRPMHGPHGNGMPSFQGNMGMGGDMGMGMGMGGPPGMGMGMGMGMPGPMRGMDGNMPSDLAFGFDSFAGGDMGGRSRGRGRGALSTGPSRGDQNDYCQHFVDTGQRPQNFLRDTHLTDRYEEYPKLKELIMRKDGRVAERATPPYYLKADLKELKLSVETFGTKFDAVLVDPPWEEYLRRAPSVADGVSWTWQEIMGLEIEAITDSPSFVFLWCGSAEGLDAGRHCLKKWGFRRCEDICWIKTNKDPQRKSLAMRPDAQSVLQHTKEHCLMGIKGTVRRSADGHIIHANIDTDIIVSEEPALGSTHKPEEMYQVIERFVMGRRRLELFGEDHNIRPGWVTVGDNLSGSNFNPQVFAGHFTHPDGTPYVHTNMRPPPGAPHLLGTTDEIEMLRPKSPPRHEKK